MSRWFRHYAGMVRDDKLVRASLIAKQPIERVVWIWGAILESAAEINDHGRYEIDCAEIAHFLHCDETDCNVSVTALETVGRVSCNIVQRWNARQFISDTSTDRVRKHRLYKNQGLIADEGNVSAALRNAPETETETEKKDAAPTVRVPEVADSDEADLFRKGRELLGRNSGGMIKKLVVAKEGSIPLARAALETASTKSDPREYIGAIIRHGGGDPRGFLVPR